MYQKNCEFLGQHAMQIMFFLKKHKIITKKEAGLTKKKSVILINKYLKNKKYQKVRNHCHYTGENKSAAHSYVN